MTTKTEIEMTADVIDLRDIIARVEDIEDTTDDDEKAELAILVELLSDLKGYGGDEQWRGDWYPVTLIRDSYFEEYAQEMAEDCCPFPRNSPEGKVLEMWPYRCIDWEQAARELKQDYATVELDGTTYWYR